MKDARGGAAPNTTGCGADPPGSCARDRIRRALLNDLPSPDRVLLLLWYAEGMTPDEIAVCLHSTTAQIEAAHARALDCLRVAVGSEAAPLA